MIKGRHVGHRPNGYASVRKEITDHLKMKGANVIAVRADTSHQPDARWYAGGGHKPACAAAADGLKPARATIMAGS